MKKRASTAPVRDPLAPFHPVVQQWFRSSFDTPTKAQAAGWPAIASGESTLIFAPTGSGKTLTAFLWCINRLMFGATPEPSARCRVIYISPLKALAVDVERNLHSPISGIMNISSAAGLSLTPPAVAVRTGDTPSRERSRFQREPSDILITTPESLYLLLTSNAREVLRSVETVIIDEIHALVPTKRGAHLSLSLERLERICHQSPQRIGLSATQRPLDEVARFLGGAVVGSPIQNPSTAAEPNREESPEVQFNPAEAIPALRPHEFRPVTVVNTGEKKKLDIRIEVPVEDMAAIGQPVAIPSGPASQGPTRSSIWPAMHPRLVELIREHHSTLIFVNSRRLAERLAAALNELAGETIVHAHHGSIAREQRVEIEDKLKSGTLPGIVATSSLELGIDMGAIDLVVQIEAPPSVASGMQRIGRAGHQVDAISKGTIFPKFRGDLVACAAAVEAMTSGAIESTAYPRNPLDVLAQQIVAMVSLDQWNAEDLYDTVRSSAPFAELSRSIFEGVLDMLSGLYPSDEFAELRPRITWNRVDGTITAREGARRVAVINGGTIPDRGLYGIFLAGAEKKAARVGELDEEMVFESRVGETFLLGASTWRIEEITHDRVIVSPAPGEPGKMPFWHGDSAERPVEFGERIGTMVRELGALSEKRALERLTGQGLDPLAAQNLLTYLAEQKQATEVVPDDRTIVIERCRDELGDWRVIILSPFGGKIHAPWAMAIVAKVRAELGIDVEAMSGDDGLIIRFPETDEPPDSRLMQPEPEEIEQLVVTQLASSALFAAKFREIATRALLLPKKRPGGRAPLWQQRKRAADLLQVAARFGSFPMLLETYRECLRDVFDMPALITTMKKIRMRTIRLVTVDTDVPSPFAASLLFRYVANYIYDGDAPMAERRAQTLSIDQSQLRELLGEVELRDLLDSESIESVGLQLQLLDERYKAKTTDGVHDMLLRIGDLTADEIALRSIGPSTDWLIALSRERRIIEIPIAADRRFAAIEDAARYRDALGVPLPSGIPERLLRSTVDPLGDLVLRYARTHAPFTAGEVALRYGIGITAVQTELKRLELAGRVLEGGFTPGVREREWCHSENLRTIRSRALSKLRKQVEPVQQKTYGRFLPAWQHVVRKPTGLNALLDAIEMLQGYPLPASILESEILPAHVGSYASGDLDTLAAAGELVWVGLEPLGEKDGRIALYLTDHLPRIHFRSDAEPDGSREIAVIDFLTTHGASHFSLIHDAAGGGFPGDTVEALWNLVWRGLVTNDTFHSLRAFANPKKRRPGRVPVRRFRSRRMAPPAAEGRWWVVSQLLARGVNPTERSHTLAHQLLARYGILAREAMANEAIPGGFSAIYDVLKLLEESGRIRRGYFVTGLTAAQFALPPAIDLLRSLREEEGMGSPAPAETDSRDSEVLLLAATDPANPYGSIIRWPESAPVRTLTRSVGARVILVRGSLGCYVFRGEKNIHVFLPDEEPDRSTVASEIARKLADLVESGSRPAYLVNEINGVPAADHPFGAFLLQVGFAASAGGYQYRPAIAARQSPLIRKRRSPVA